MSYSKQPKSKKSNQTKPIIKKQKPKPEWTTDFVDRTQYKLSTAEMVQKRQALQSKNKQLARQQLQERRRKLELGIIDQQTRKIYQTALLSKNIDINPPLRRNLTEMIRYEKQHKQKMAQQGEYNDGNQNEQQYDPQEQSIRDLKQAQQFIKKFQKAKKQQKIERAVQILTHNHSTRNQNKHGGIRSPEKQPKVNNFLDYMNQQNSYTKKTIGNKQSQSFSQDQAISSIQDTIRFMEEKLFAAKKTVEEHSKSFINEDQEQSFSRQPKEYNYTKNKNAPFAQNNEIKRSQKTDLFKKTKIKSDQINFATTKQSYKADVIDYQDELDYKIGQISQLRINPKHQNSSDDQCLDTIRRMREIMQNKQLEYEVPKKQSKRLKQNINDNAQTNSLSLGYNSTIYKNSHNYLQSQAQVSFNLTVNNDDQYQKQSSILKDTLKHQENNFMITDNYKLGKDPIKKAKKSTNLNEYPNFKKFNQDQYEDEYQKIKQNLFNCINSPQEISQPSKTKNATSNDKKIIKNIHIDQDSQQQSQDSLMIKDRIKMWKKQLQPQIQPSDDDEDQAQTKPKVFQKKPVHQISLVKNNDDEIDDDQAYKYNFMNQNSNKTSIKDIQSNKYPQRNFQKPNQSYKSQTPQTNLNMLKKPPIIKKNKQGQNQLQVMKQMISKASSQIQKIQIQPLKIQPLNPTGQILGFDFRGSINIKKNILSSK